MITRDELRHLAELESPEGGAVSFYFQPIPPQDKSHHGEVVAVKEKVRDALRRLPANGGSAAGIRRDLERILAMNELWHGDHHRARAIFACPARDFWRQYDLPARLGRTEVFLNSRFQLRPLLALGERLSRCLVVGLDRERARFFELVVGEIRLKDEFRNELPPHGASEGFLGYDAGHSQRHLDAEAHRHFRRVAARARDLMLTGGCDKLLVFCRDDVWSEFEPLLHPYLKGRLLGRNSLDPVQTTPDEIRDHVEKRLDELETAHRGSLVEEVLAEARRNGRGALGLRRVLNALERGEVQTLVLDEGFQAQAVECPHCDHLDYRLVSSCAVCGQPTRELENVTDHLVTRALRGGANLACVAEHAEFSAAGRIGALLRFRADRSTTQAIAG
ncbi:MAG TPA: hypothetical protein VLE48_00165 [Terriglobales bacterium]|nr:hypothetical protein [Terriglobales bacterium]